mgnify:FL=1
MRAESDVLLNKPYLGSYEITTAGERFAALASEAEAAGITLSAAQAEFRREFLMGETNAAYIARPGTDWPDPDPERVDLLARACKTSWDAYRAG